MKDVALLHTMASNLQSMIRCTSDITTSQGTDVAEIVIPGVVITAVHCSKTKDFDTN